ncbi:MAG: DUF4359 domain-containing protein [Oculatellaceae cyanobacterium Prado106]|jgi:hypothetical protein|nr:DUF4359 domain-containing protein [Oculatellaceae cyanobacterium Prado106]
MKVAFYLASMAVVGLGVAMAVTNPSQSVYEDYATQQLVSYLKTNTCAEAGEVLKGSCNALLDQNQSEIRGIIAANTQRENFGILSIYKTNLSVGQLLPSFLGGLLPSYQFETVGVLSSFHIYEARKQ